MKLKYMEEYGKAKTKGKKSELKISMCINNYFHSQHNA